VAQIESVELPNGDNVGVVAAWVQPKQAGSAANTTAEEVFLTLLKRYTASNRKVGSKPGRNYAPALFAKEREAKQAKLGNTALQEAMLRLFDDARITCDPGGRADRDTAYIVLCTP
jgi:hypothetical protein